MSVIAEAVNFGARCLAEDEPGSQDLRNDILVDLGCA